MSEIPDHSARLHAIVHGAVQGVGFRFFARRQALALCLRGYTRNLPNGTVVATAVTRSTTGPTARLRW